LIEKTSQLPLSMIHPSYPQSAYRRFPIQGFTVRKNRPRRRWPMIVLSFILGLLAGWAIRGGGAWLP
jgi:hypothetical protein